MVQSKLLFLFAVPGLAAAVPASAQTFCFPAAVGVPGQHEAPTTITDARWNGAFAHILNDSKVDFRALTWGAQKFLVMTWDVQGDFGGSTPNDVDTVIAQFIDDSTAPPTGNLIRFQRLAFSSTTAGTVAGGKLAAQIYNFTGTTTTSDWSLVASKGLGADFGTLPPWLLNDALVDLECSPDGCSDWTVTVKIPLSATATPDDPATGLKLPAKFRFAYQVNLQHEDGSGGIYSEGPFTWPGAITEVDFSAPSFPDPNSLALSQRAGGPDPCATGISIDSSQIRVEHGTPAVVGTDIAINQPNTFRAHPKNGLAFALPQSGIEASFRIADWGAIAVSPEWNPVPNCTGVKMAGTGSVAAGANFDISCSWTLSPAEQCKYGRASLPPATCASYPTTDDRNSHQCVFVELKPASGAILPPGSFFSSQSAYQNMNFVTASKLVSSARLQLRAPPAGAVPTRTLVQARDVYVFIEAKNMPARTPSNAPGSLLRPDVLKRIRDPQLAKKLDELGVRDGKIGSAVASVIKEQARLGKISHREIAAVLPTYVAYVWHDTGRRTKINGREAKVLAADPPFGYYVSHDGPLTGWKFGIAGSGVKTMGPNLYRVSVPVKRGVQVSSWLQACEDQRCLTAKPPK